MQIELPEGASSSGRGPPPAQVRLAPNLGYVGVTYASGAALLYRIVLPPPPRYGAGADALAALSLAAWGESQLVLVAHLTRAHVEGEGGRVHARAHWLYGTVQAWVG